MFKRDYSGMLHPVTFDDVPITCSHLHKNRIELASIPTNSYDLLIDESTCQINGYLLRKAEWTGAIERLVKRQQIRSFCIDIGRFEEKPNVFYPNLSYEDSDNEEEPYVSRFPYESVLTILRNNANNVLLDTVFYQRGRNSESADQLLNWLLSNSEETLKNLTIIDKHFRGYVNKMDAELIEAVEKCRKIENLCISAFWDLARFGPPLQQHKLTHLTLGKTVMKAGEMATILNYLKPGFLTSIKLELSVQSLDLSSLVKNLANQPSGKSIKEFEVYVKFDDEEEIEEKEESDAYLSRCLQGMVKIPEAIPNLEKFVLAFNVGSDEGIPFELMHELVHKLLKVIDVHSVDLEIELLINVLSHDDALLLIDPLEFDGDHMIIKENGSLKLVIDPEMPRWFEKDVQVV